MPGVFLLAPISGSVGLSEAPTVVQGPSGSEPWKVDIVSGSVVLSASQTVDQGASGSVPWRTELQSGSVVGLFVGGQPVSDANPLPISGSLSVSFPASQNVTGSDWTPVVDQGASGSLHWKVELKPGTSVQIGNFTGDDIGSVVRSFVEHSGSRDMNVDGSSTNVVFVYEASASVDIVVNELRLVASFDEMGFNSSGNFGLRSTLTNGVLVEVTSGGETVELANVTRNEEFLLFPSPSIVLNTAGEADVVVVSFPLGVTLSSGSSDNVKITIRDDITDSTSNLWFFQGSIVGVKS